MRTTLQGLWCVAVLALVVGVASSAHAVVGDASVSVTDVSGRAVAGATVRLVPKRPGLPEVETTTDANGTAQVRTEEGDYDVFLIVGGRQRSAGSVRVGPEQAVLNAVFDPIATSAATRPNGFSVGPYFTSQFLDWDLASETETQVVNGAVSVVQNPSAGNDFTTDFYVAGVQISKGGPSFDVLGVNVQPTLDFAVGGGWLDVDVAPVGLSQEGKGPVVATGASFTIRPPLQPYFAILDYHFAWQGLDMKQKPCSPAVPGLVSCASSTDATLMTHSVGLQAGYGFGPLAVHAGVGYGGSRLENDIAVDRLISSTSGTLSVQNYIDQELARDKVEGIFGVDVGWGPIFGRAETRFNAHDASVFLTINTGLPGL